LQRGQIKKGSDQLKSPGDTLTTYPVAMAPGNISAQEKDFTAIRFHEPGYYIKQGRLAGTVRADDTQYLTFVELKAKMIDGHQPTERFGNIFYFKSCNHFTITPS
jgi:hypothetical protein